MRNAILDAMVITKRQLLQLARVPELLVFSTIQPVMFVLLFRYVFGGSIDTGQPGGYVQLLMPGIFVQTVAFTLASTAIGLAEDMKKGLIDRFRSLPISRGAVIIGRTFGDALLNILVLVVMALAGFAVGWRPTSGIFQTTLAFLFLFMFGYALVMDWNFGWPVSQRGPHSPKRWFLGHLPIDLLIKRFCTNYRNA
jgi:ABC-2 type transport system permease protein